MTSVQTQTAGPDGKPNGHGKNLPIEKLNVTYFAKRLRLGSDPSNRVVDHRRCDLDYETATGGVELN
jgi:hypothetical protein